MKGRDRYMGIRYMCKEREDNLIDISDGFNPDSGWYRIADYRVNDLKVFMKKGINITYDDSCKYVKELVENNK